MASTVRPTPRTNNTTSRLRIGAAGVRTLAGRAICTKINAAIPTGTFSQNTARQLTVWVRKPPSNGPTARKI